MLSAMVYNINEVMKMTRAYTGYFQDGRFVSPEAMTIPNNVKVYIVVSDEQPTEEQEFNANEKQMLELIKNIPTRTLEVNEQGHIIVDKEKDPDLYDWAVNG